MCALRCGGDLPAHCCRCFTISCDARRRRGHRHAQPHLPSLVGSEKSQVRSANRLSISPTTMGSHRRNKPEAWLRQPQTASDLPASAPVIIDADRSQDGCVRAPGNELSQAPCENHRPLSSATCPRNRFFVVISKSLVLRPLFLVFCSLFSFSKKLQRQKK